MRLQRGEKRGLSDLGVGNSCTIKVDFGLDGVDIAAFGLNKDRKIGDDRYVVLFSNTASPERAITLQPSSDTAVFNLDLDKLPAAIDRIVFTATHDSRPIAESRPLVVTVDGVKASFDVAEHLTTEKAVMMVEIYRHSSGWRIGTIAAGFAGGLASLIAHFGGEVEAPPPSAPAAAASPPPPPPPPPAAPVSLKKVTLAKSNGRVSLKKTGSTFGEIILNLNWSQQQQKRGFFGGGGKNVDLDLGVLFEMKNGFKGCIQALGRNFGDFDQEPWIELSGDDRTGAVAAGETIRVNGRYFDNIKRLGVFALIYDGVPNWQQTDGVVRMTIPGQPEVEVHLDEGRDNCRLCGIAVIENVNGVLQMDRHMRYYQSQKPFADDIGIILRWAAGSKD
ncbi:MULTISPECIES: TerD family protein [Sphingomonadaceae]|uniref:TerD family protein n=2 Tax=Sphingomonadaceae TaxID=41297 RepID=A0A9X7U6J3_SPHYA|nr:MULTISPECIES: TerD family protein [Sphingomonadaceae]EZP84321.1 Tellurium resistance [Novosphingobium resinovorum]MAM10069.1 Tellurium resistance [Rhizobiaceae bacterium]PZU69019.1 MAG: Tellurium resistance [Sphingobium sp.]QNG44638.1 TerD family protein [Sphingobium yanoikuyae]|tara:strand:- start:13266 stop:14438 length:1173 start_codon:yes stop_codon:yes gene_type:complete